MKHLLLMLILILSGGSLFGTPVFNVVGQQNNEAVTYEKLEGASAYSSIGELLAASKNLSLSESLKLDLTAPNNHFWGRFHLENSDDKPKTLYFYLDELIDIFELYIPNVAGIYSKKVVGDKVPSSEKYDSYRKQIIKVVVPPGVTTYYFRLDSKSAIGVRYLKVFDENYFLETIRLVDVIESSLLGIFGVMITYNFMLWMSFRTKAYAYYLGYLLSFFIVQAIGFQHAAFYIFPDSIGGWFVQNAGMYLTSAICSFSCLFTNSFLDMSTKFPRLSKLLLALSLFFVIYIPVGPFIGKDNLVNMVYQAAAIPCMLYAGWISVWRGFRPAIFYLIAWSFFVGGASMWNLIVLNLIEPNFFVWYSPFIGAAIECALFALAIGYKVRHENAESQKEIYSLNKVLSDKIQEIRQKEKARTIFFNNASHELRTPLQGIIGYIEMLDRGKKIAVTAGLNEVFQKILRLANGLKDLLNTILDVARANKGELKLKAQDVDLDLLTADIENLIEGLRANDSGFDFVLNTSWQRGQGAVFVTDFQLIKTILRNLIGNAYKFRRGEVASYMNISLELVSSSLEITVVDNGIGIAEKDLENIFEQFRQVDDSEGRFFEGTGLGLSLVKKIITLMNGSISVKSTLGEGSTFSVGVPALGLPRLTQVPKDNSIASGSLENSKIYFEKGYDDFANRNGAGETILIVDDHAENLETLSMLMTDYGYEVKTAKNGGDALWLIQKGIVDLVLLDLMMPGMSGEEVLEKIRLTPEGQALPVIFLTARASREDHLAGLKAGADDYLPKPIDSSILLEKVRNHLDRIAHAYAGDRQSKFENKDPALIGGWLSRREYMGFHNVLDSGVLVFDSSLKVTAMTGASLSALYGTERDSVSVEHPIDLIFTGSKISDEERQKILNILQVMFSEREKRWLPLKESLPSMARLNINNDIRDLELKWIPVLNDECIACEIVVTFRDITQYRHLEVVLKRERYRVDNIIACASELLAEDSSSLGRFCNKAKVAVDILFIEINGDRDHSNIHLCFEVIRKSIRSLEAKKFLAVLGVLESLYEALLKIKGSAEGSDGYNLRIVEHDFLVNLEVLNTVLIYVGRALELPSYNYLGGFLDAQLGDKIVKARDGGYPVTAISWQDDVIYWKKSSLAKVAKMIGIAIENSIEHSYLAAEKSSIARTEMEVDIWAFLEEEKVVIKIRDRRVGLCPDIFNTFEQGDEGVDISRIIPEAPANPGKGKTSPAFPSGLRILNSMVLDLDGSAVFRSRKSGGMELVIGIPRVLVWETFGDADGYADENLAANI